MDPLDEWPQPHGPAYTLILIYLQLVAVISANTIFIYKKRQKCLQIGAIKSD